jgi:GT2 family glycosyltransferase
MYVEEVDWCRRARQRGWEIWYEPRATVVHHGGSATRQHAHGMFSQLWRSRLRYYQRFHGPAKNRAVHALVRLGMLAQARRAARSPARLRAVESVRQLVE